MTTTIECALVLLASRGSVSNRVSTALGVVAAEENLKMYTRNAQNKNYIPAWNPGKEKHQSKNAHNNAELLAWELAKADTGPKPDISDIPAIIAYYAKKREEARTILDNNQQR